MSFAWPALLWLLIAPAALLAWEISHRRRNGDAPAHPKILRAEAGAHQLALSARPPSGGSRSARPWLCAGIALAIVAVARPQWGRIEEPVFDQSREILLAIDLSRSMLTPDVKPSRLDRAKLLIMSLLEKLAGERVGLVVFSGTAFLQSPLSADYEILREFLPSLGPDFLPEGGTNYRALIDTSLDAFGSSGSADRFLIVLSDGEATDDEWKARAEKLKTKGIRVIGLGVGTAAGAMIPDGSGGFVKDERGAVVLSKLESGTLQELARVAGGVYRDASTWVDLAALLKETIEAGRKGEFLETNTIRLVERYQWPLGLALWCLVVSLCYEFPIRPRPRELKLTRSAAPGPKSQAQPAVVASVLLALMWLWPAPASRAAATLAHPPKAAPAPAPTTTENPAPAPSAGLARIVGRLSTTRTPTARDWAELGRETVTWGSRLQSEKQMVPEGPVRDALQAVDLGSSLDAKTADWPKLKQELEALLKKPDDKQDDKKDQQDQNEQQNQDQKEQNQKQDQKQSKDKKQSDDEQSSDDKKNSDPDQQNQPQDSKTKPPEDQPKPGESAFGDMKEKSEPPPPPQDTQQVGGAEKKEAPPEAADPSLALPLQKLDQLRNQDSPARLFELMEGEKKPGQKKSGKDW